VATKAVLAKMGALSMPSPLCLGGRPRPRLGAGGCGAKVALLCSTWAGLEAPAGSGACKQRQAGKMVPKTINYYHTNQSQTQVWIKTKRKDPIGTDYVLQCETKCQLTCLIPLRYDEHLT
jgi:hypothetical protein